MQATLRKFSIVTLPLFCLYFLESTIYFAQFSKVVTKKVLIFDQMILIENEVVLLCVTMRERAKGFAAIT